MSIFYRKYELFPESILIRDFADKVSVYEVIDSWEYLIENNMIGSSIKGVINNISGCKLEMDMDSFQILMDYLKRKDSLRRIKLAVICDNPKMIVFPLLGEFKEKELKIRPFSTLEAAAEWIMSGE
jgi:hypothetical protein